MCLAYFLDSSIRSRFTIAFSEDQIPTNQEEVAKNFYTALQGFFNLKPLFRGRQFYVSSESYAGKYASSLGMYMLNKLDKKIGEEGRALPLRKEDHVREIF